MSQIELLERRFAREKNARRQAEDLLEKKSLDLYEINKTLEEQNLALQLEIEERKNTEKILEEKTTLLDSLFTNSVELSIATTDLDMRITYFNSVAEKLFHYKAEEVIGKTVHDIHLMEKVAPERLAAAIQIVEKTGEYKYQVVGESDGYTQIVNSRVTAVRGSSGKMTGYVLFSQDVTQKTIIEEKLKLQSVALESAVDAIGITDQTGNIVWVNPAFTALTGYTKEEMLGQNPKMLKSGKHEKPYYTILWDTITSGRVWKNEIINRHKDGHLYYEEISITPVKDKQGEIVNFITIKRDISLRKEAEKELKRSKELAESANRAKSKFLANMSHEIRTPLNGLISMLNLLDESALNIRQRDYLDMAMISVESLLSIINDILDFSKIEAGMLTLEPKPFQLEFELSRTLGLFAPKAEKNGVELILGFDPNLPRMVVGDLIRLKQILNNLIHNALKFTRQGYIWVQVHCLATRGKTVDLKISVQDTGIGIPKEKQASIFEYFTQADTSTTRKFGGTGLGLSICTQLAKLMGGSIELNSCPQKGSTFSVLLSLPIDNSEAASKPDLAWLTDKRVLLLDDNQINLDLFSTYLSFYNIRHQVSQKQAEAFNAMKMASAEKDPFHLVITNHSMPEMTGEEFNKQVFSHADLKATKMVRMAPMEMINKAERNCQGFCLCIPKPVGMYDFLMLLNTVGTSKGCYMAVQKTLSPSQNCKKNFLENAVEDTNLKILLVEDNLINQVAAKEILKKIGFGTIDIASNGQEAFDLIKQQSYDLVFMDVQMPIMDGLEATRTIRTWEKQEPDPKKYLPIIAMTANAIDGDREKCLDAGMDDYISKPIRKELLIEMLKKWVGKIRTSRNKHQDIDDTPESETKNSTLVFNYQETLERYEGDQNILKIIIELFFKQTPDMIREIEECINQKRIADIAAIAHSLKGGASHVGADEIVESAKIMEKMNLATDPVEASRLLFELEAGFEAFKEELKAFDFTGN